MLGQRATVQVALAWTGVVAATDATSVSNLPTATTLSVDLDLLVYQADHGALVAFSSSYDNSYEVVTFAGEYNTEYQVRVRRSSGTDDVYSGIAWNVTIK